MARAQILLATLLAAATACGVELGEPPDVSGNDGKSDNPNNPGEGSGSGGGSGSMPLSATSFLVKIGNQYCDECFRCKANYPDGTTVFAQDFGATTQECYAGTSNYYGPALVEQSITAGRVTYNATSAQACLAGIIYQQSCGTFWQNPPQFPASCDAALVGKVADGGSCLSIFDCSNLDSVCDDTTKKCTP